MNYKYLNKKKGTPHIRQIIGLQLSDLAIQH
ncbi:hypothetical protein IWX83_003351 [Flavobacterium sp. CG_9.1]|nr:hypothetical protein [Flavobacterium sp. CG_9.1]